MIRSRPTASAPLSAPPKRRARPPARMAAETPNPTLISYFARFPAQARICHERGPDRSRARRQPASGDCRSAADAARVLRELAQRRRAARRHHRPGAADRRPQLPAYRRARLPPDHGARGRVRRGMDVRERAGAEGAGDSRAAGGAAGARRARHRTRPGPRHLSQLARHHQAEEGGRHHRHPRLALLRSARGVRRAAVRVLCVRDRARAGALRRDRRRAGQRVPRVRRAPRLRGLGHSIGARERQRGRGMIAALLCALVWLAPPTRFLPAAAPPKPTAQAGPRVAPIPAPRILVVPFETPGRDGRTYWLGEAAAILIADDVNARGLGAIIRPSRERAYDQLHLPPNAVLSRATVIKVGEIVGAGQVIVGEVSVEGDALTVKARPIRIDVGRAEAGVVERGPLADLFAIVRRVARRVVPGGRVGSGVSLMALKQYDEAFTVFKTLQDAAPDPAILNNLGVIQLRRQASPEAGSRSTTSRRPQRPIPTIRTSCSTSATRMRATGIRRGRSTGCARRCGGIPPTATRMSCWRSRSMPRAAPSRPGASASSPRSSRRAHRRRNASRCRAGWSASATSSTRSAGRGSTRRSPTPPSATSATWPSSTWNAPAASSKASRIARR